MVFGSRKFQIRDLQPRKRRFWSFLHCSNLSICYPLRNEKNIPEIVFYNLENMDLNFSKTEIIKFRLQHPLPSPYLFKKIYPNLCVPPQKRRFRRFAIKWLNFDIFTPPPPPRQQSNVSFFTEKIMPNSCCSTSKTVRFKYFVNLQSDLNSFSPSNPLPFQWEQVNSKFVFKFAP